MDARRAVLAPAHVQDGRLKLDLLPPKVTDLDRSEPVAEGQEDHRPIAVRLPIGLGGLDQKLDLVLGEAFTGPIVGIGSPPRRYCPFFAGWCHQPQCWISHEKSPVLTVLCQLNMHFTDRSVPHWWLTLRSEATGAPRRTPRQPQCLGRGATK